METDVKNYVIVSLKKSSSKDGGVGYDITVFTDGSVPQEQLQKIADNASSVALRTAVQKLGK